MMTFDLQKYLSDGVEIIVKDALRASFKNPKEALYLRKFSKYSRRATEIRQNFSENGKNIPVFLIASITSSCNLHCTGCYSRASNACNDEEPLNQLSADQWEDIFKQAKDIGISFIVLAGGEPMIREDVIRKASGYPEILFPIFTNGTLINDDYFKLFDKNRNLVPIFSIEGDEAATNSRRGEGIYSKLTESMEQMKNKNIIFGASVTYTRKNLRSLMSDNFIAQLHDFGCKVIFFIEYVPMNENTIDLAPTDTERNLLFGKIDCLRDDYEDMIFLTFPGDEKTSEGCLAAGRGFFHINSHGGAEPCPASPYFDTNVCETSILDALDSKLFKSLRDEGHLLDDHRGGCTLFENKQNVERILKGA